MQDIYPDRVFSDSSKPAHMGRVEEFRKDAFFGIDPEIASCDEHKKPREKRKIVGGIEACTVYTEREQNSCIIGSGRNTELQETAEAEISVLYVHCEHEEENAENNSHKRRKLVKCLFGKSEYHHAYAHEVQYSEKDSSTCEEGQNECHYHADEEALYTSFEIIGRVPAHST